MPSAMYLAVPLEYPEEKSFIPCFQWQKQSCANRFKSQRLLNSHTVCANFFPMKKKASRKEERELNPGEDLPVAAIDYVPPGRQRG